MIDVEAIRKRYQSDYLEGGPQHPVDDVGTLLTELTRLQALAECIYRPLGLLLISPHLTC